MACLQLCLLSDKCKARQDEGSWSICLTHFSHICRQAELSRVPPIQLLRPSCRPWRGAMDLRGVVARLAEVLPPSFEDLERPFAVTP